MLNGDALNSTKGIFKRRELIVYLKVKRKMHRKKENLIKQLNLLKNKINTEKITQIMETSRSAK